MQPRICNRMTSCDSRTASASSMVSRRRWEQSKYRCGSGEPSPRCREDAAGRAQSDADVGRHGSWAAHKDGPGKDERCQDTYNRPRRGLERYALWLRMPSPCELPLKPCSAISEVGLPRVRDRKAESGRWKSFNASISTTNALKTCRLRRSSMCRIRFGETRLRRTPFAQDGRSS